MSLEPRLGTTRSVTKHAGLHRDAARHQCKRTKNNQDGPSSRTVHWSWLSECRDVRSEWKHRLSDPDRKSGRSLETDRRDIHHSFGFDTPVIIRDSEQMRNVIANNPFLREKDI